MSNTTVIDNQKEESSRIYTLFYSFFLIPFMIAIFGAIFFLLFRFITYETNDASELLNQVKIGSATKRWQSAYELSKVLNNPETAEPLAVVEGTRLTAFRTGAASGVATKYLSSPTSQTLALVGSGIQSFYQAEATLLIRDIKTIKL